MEWYAKRRFGDLADDAAEKFGDREALVFKDQRYSFNEQAQEINRTAKALIASGVQHGDHVALWLNNCADWVFFNFALAKIGAVMVPINTRFRTNDLDYVLRQSDSRFLITHDTSGPIGYLEMVREVISLPNTGDSVDDPSFPKLRRVLITEEVEPNGVMTWTAALKAGQSVSDDQLAARSAAVDPDDPVFIMYTSGTTGFPKGVVHSHKLIRNVEERGFRMAVSDRDTILNYLPMFHAFGYSDGILMAPITGARQIVTETFDSDECLDLIESEGASIMHGFEAHFKALTEAQEAYPRDVSSLRTGIFAAGMHSATPVIRQGNQVLSPIRSVSGYGMTEIWLGAAIGALDEDETLRWESSGETGLGYELKIVDPITRKDQPVGVPGELLVKGYSLMLEYYKKPEETAAAFDKDGWFITGDSAVWLENGYMRFLGRYKDMLKVGGENVDPMEAEGLLLEHPEIHQVAVVGMPDDKLSEVGVAYVQLVPDSSMDAEAVIAHCQGKLASFKIPHHVVFVEDFPMTASGKIRKVELREDAKKRASQNAE
ncbi:MAG: AMP-binding protein [Rickettsiales bacterium]|nr:AMP-binding protein [Rickettsiales bacterium]